MVHCIIPARFASSRYPGKLLAPLGASTVLLSTYRRAMESRIFDSVTVAAGDSFINDYCLDNGIKSIEAFDDFENGSERVIWAASKLNLSGPVVNVQADQPLFDQVDLKRLTDFGVLNDDLATLLHPISMKYLNTALKPVYATINQKSRIITFSRLQVPAGHSDKDFMLHIGVYFFPERFWRSALKVNVFHNCNWSKSENLEQLNLLCSNQQLLGVEASSFPPEINTREDLEYANSFLKRGQNE